jgi:hypothetical protein
VIGRDDRPTSAVDEPDPAFRGFAVACAYAVGIGGFAYSVAFVAVLRGSGEPAAAASAAFLLIGGLLATPVLVAVYLIVRPTSPGMALWALTIGLTGAIGSAIHGGFDLANVINEPSGNAGGFPNAVDPRGLLTFGFAAVGTATVAWLILRGGRLPRRLGLVAAVLAALLLVIYIGRLVVLDPEHPILLVAALATGFVVNPLWWIWLGVALRRADRETDR